VKRHCQLYPSTLNRTLSQMKVIALLSQYHELSKSYQALLDSLDGVDDKDKNQLVHSLSAQKAHLDYLESKPLQYKDWIWLCNVLKHV
jgi:hypothetical protein